MNVVPMHQRQEDESRRFADEVRFDASLPFDTRDVDAMRERCDVVLLAYSMREMAAVEAIGALVGLVSALERMVREQISEAERHEMTDPL